MPYFRRSFPAPIIFLLAAFSVQADVKLPAIFGDHMVLQEGMKVPVWGTATPGEKVTVTVGDKKTETTTGTNGKWLAQLSPLAESKKPTTMTVTGKNTIMLSDVLVGDVWVCSGQSNMEFNLHGTFGQASNAATAVPAANDEALRLFLVKKKSSAQPEADVIGQWKVCTPESASPFSAVGYFFGRDLRAALHKPIGLIGTYWGGTRAQAWTSVAGLRKEPSLKDEADAYDKHLAALPRFVDAYNKNLAAYQAQAQALKQSGGDPSTLPKAPRDPNDNKEAPAALFNGMVAPLVPYAIKGVIWYQGEKNAYQPMLYRKLFPALINDWRAQWNQGDFPFIFVQLARFHGGSTPSWAFQRESQFLTLSLPHTGMAVAFDIGNPAGVHPTDKMDVGHRLALAARHVAYGEDLVYSGPVYDKMKIEGNTATISFAHVGSGLMIGAAPWVASRTQAIPTASLVGFTITGDNTQWVAAEAKIVGDTVVVSSPQVPHPVAVRYDWANTMDGNLYNKEMLPAVPFRTDNLTFTDSKSQKESAEEK